MCSSLVGAQLKFEDQTIIYMSDNIMRSALPIGVFDLDGDFQDDIITLNEGNILTAYLNSGILNNMDFVNLQAPVSPTPEWSFAAGDLDNDGIPEIIVSGLYNNVKVYKYEPVEMEFSLFHKTPSQSYGQGSNVVDFNNDGFNDYFLCHDEGESRLFINDGTGRLSIMKGLLDFTTDPSSDMSGNYGSEWIDIDDDGVLELYMAKCSVRASEYTDPRRINQLLKKGNDGIYRDIAKEIGLAHGDQSWVSTFSDLDNDGDLDCIIANHHSPHMILENIEGSYVQRDLGVGDILSFAFQLITADFDNNGYEDILITGGSDDLLLNYGNFEFELIEEVFTYNQIHSAAVGDINNDGFIDAYVSYGIPIQKPGNRRDAIWINKGNSNNYLKLSMKGVTSNRQAIGTKVKLYTTEGIQQRTIKGGQSYGIVNSFNLHFGLGVESTIDSIEITWPNGLREKYFNLDANTHYFLEEGGCKTEVLRLSVSNPNICPDDDEGISLNLNDVEDVKWSDGSVGNEISIDAPGNYSATARAANGCPVVTDLLVIVPGGIDTFELPYKDTLELCPGESIEFSDTLLSSVIWNVGDNTAQIVPLEEGLYTVSVTDRCGENYEDNVEVVFLQSYIEGYSDTIMKGDTAYLSLMVENPRWYKSKDSETYISEDNIFKIQDIQIDTSIWVESWIYPEKTVFNVGKAASDESSPYPSDDLNAVMRFDIIKPLNIVSVTCYTDTPGERDILITNVDRSEVFRKKVMLDSGENKVILNAFMEPSKDYRMTTDTSVNMASLGFQGPRLHRSAEDVFYPYLLSDFIEITGSENGPNYYNFYDWEIESERRPCISERVEIKVIVDFSEAVNDNISESLKIFPNPTRGNISIELSQSLGDIYMRVFSIKGEVIFEKSILSNKEIIDVSHLTPGLYFIQLTGENILFSKKMIKM